MKMFARLLLAALVSAPSFAHAYFIASLSGHKVIDSSKPVHVLISGRGRDLGRSPQNSALGVGARIHQVEPDAQVILISVFEDPKNRQSLESKGAVFTKINEEAAFKTSTVMPELLKFSKISSLQFFGHNSSTLGIQTDGPGARFDFRESQVAKLRGHFTADAFMFIYGCNGGWYLAPLMSKTLGIPAAGAFTGTHFEKMNEDQNFYTTSLRGTPNANWAVTNRSSFDEPRDCAKGVCLRMRPGNAPYKGHWGDLTTASLAFYKFFCINNSAEQCERAMAKSLLYSLTTQNPSVNSSREKFIEAAKDFVCPPSKTRELTNECARAMDTALSGGTRVYSSLKSAKALQCDFKSCEMKFACTTTGGVDGNGTCSVIPTTTKAATTQADEFLAYVRGFDRLQK